jgi:dipeptidyl aminopeptidase/acylaminoacyl peptidase
MSERERRGVIQFPVSSHFLFILLVLTLCIPLLTYSQGKALVRIDEDVQAFAIGPDNRIVYAVQHMRKFKKARVERDDLWISSPEGKQKKISDGEKIFADMLLNYQVQSFAWSPDGHRIAVMMQTAEMVPPKGTRDQQLDEEETQAPRGMVAVYLMDDEGHQIPIQGMKDGLLNDGYNATWLADGKTLVYVTKTGADFNELNTLLPSQGKSKPLFQGHTFAALAWDTKNNQAFAIEESTRVLTSPMLVRLNLATETRTPVAPVDEYVGGFAVSTSGKKAGYFRDGDTLEVRDLLNPTTPAVQVKVAIGVFQWGRDDRRVLLKRGDPLKSGNLTWVGVYDGRFEPVLHDLVFHDFELSPNGELVAVTEPGKRSLLLYGLH